MEVQLSVCIPTYNFGAFIGETLNSILIQMRPGIEVLVLDSASTDDTPSIIADLQAKYSCLRYQRDDRRGGIDRDMARVVELARGRYCWLFSADDLMSDGAIEQVMAELDELTDVYICTHSNETIDMRVMASRHPVLNVTQNAHFDLSDPTQQQEYFSLALTTEAFFSFISGLIVKRATWMREPLSEPFIGSCWAHVARLFELTRTGLRVKYLSQVLVRRRSDNDSFAANGVVRRYGLAINGFQRLGEHFWGDQSAQAFHIRRVLRREFRLRAFLHAKVLCAQAPQRESRSALDQMMRSIYSDGSAGSAARRIIYRCFPVSMYAPLRTIYKFLLG
jgi:abequosyltransferase